MSEPSRKLYGRGLMLSASGMIILSPDALFIRLIIDATVWDIIFWRTLFMGISLGLALALRYRTRLVAVVRGGGRVMAAAAVLMALSNFGFVGAITHTTVANALVIFATIPLFSAVFGWLLIGEKVDRRTWTAIAVALAGIIVVFFDSLGGGNWAGDLMALAAAVMHGLNLVVLRKAGGPEMIPALCLSGFLAAAIAWPLAAPAAVSPHDLGILAVVGLAMLPLSLGLFISGLRYVAAAEVALLTLIETVLGPLWVWLGIGETPSVTALIGGIVVIGAIAGNALLGLRRAPGGARKGSDVP